MDLTTPGIGATLLHRYRRMREAYGQSAADQVVEAMAAELDRFSAREVERLMSAPAPTIVVTVPR